MSRIVQLETRQIDAFERLLKSDLAKGDRDLTDVITAFYMAPGNGNLPTISWCPDCQWERWRRATGAR